MSHEGTSGIAEALATDVQAIVQALVPEPSTAISGADVRAAILEDGEGTVVRAMEAIRAEVAQAASEPIGPPPLTQFTGSGAGKDHAVFPEAVTQAKEPVAEAQEGSDMVATSVAEKVQTKGTGVKKVLSRARLKKVKAKNAPPPAKRAKSKVAKRSIARVPVDGAGANVRKAKAAQTLAAAKAPKTRPPQEPRKFTVPEVWRSIVKKNERQGSKRYDVLVCQHAVPANDNTYRTARACPECRLAVQRYADEVAAARARKAPRRRKA